MNTRVSEGNPTVITAILLAAGESRRMGRHKVLLPFGDTSVLQHIVHVLQRSGVSDVVAVTGHQADDVARTLSGTGVRTACNADYLSGMLSSVRCGIQAADPRTGGFLIVLGDQPCLEIAVVRRLITEFHQWNEPKHGPADGASRPARGIILVPTFGGRRGHPLLFSSEFADDVLRHFDETGLKGLLSAWPDRVVEVDVEQSAILRDMDYPEDYARELLLRRPVDDG